MIRADLAYLYEYSKIFTDINSIKIDSKSEDVVRNLGFIKAKIEEFINGSIYSAHLSTCSKSTDSFLGILTSFLDRSEINLSQDDIALLQWKAYEFEIILKSALANTPAYIVTPKGGYNVDILTLTPEMAFPPLLLSLVPDSAYDVEQAGKCLAFEIPTGTAFYLHRIGEAVLHRYWDIISENATRPKIGTIDSYLKAMQVDAMKDKKWDDKIISTLDQIRKLHRNPVAHPDQNLNPQEALELFGIVYSVISAMLSAIEAAQISTQNP